MKVSTVIAASAVVNAAPAETPISTGAFLLLTVLLYSKRAVVFKPLFAGFLLSVRWLFQSSRHCGLLW